MGASSRASGRTPDSRSNNRSANVDGNPITPTSSDPFPVLQGSARPSQAVLVSSDLSPAVRVSLGPFQVGLVFLVRLSCHVSPLMADSNDRPSQLPCCASSVLNIRLFRNGAKSGSAAIRLGARPSVMVLFKCSIVADSSFVAILTSAAK